MTELSNEHTYILRYDSERGGAMCATRTGIGSRIELQPLVPELIDIQGWVLDHLDGSTYRIIDPTAYDDSKEYGITEPAEIGPPNAVSLGDPSEFNFTTGRGEPTKYSMGESVLLLTAASNASHARRSSLSVSLPGTPAAATGPGVTVRSRGSLPGKVQRLGGVELGGAEGLVLALSALKDKGGPNVDLSVRAVTVSLSPLPTKPPVLVLVPLEAHDTLTTPSAICFVPPMGASWSRPEPQPSSAPRRPRPVSSIELSGTTSAAAVERVIAHVKRVVGELTGTGIPVVAYTPSTAPLPSQIVGALEDAGCKGVLAPPFSPDSVQATLTKVRPWSKVQPAVITLEPISSPRIVPAAPIHAPKPSLSLASLPSTSYTPQPESSTSQMSTLPALAPLVPPPPHLAARASYSCPHIYAPALPPCVRRRSVDVGGLALALSGAGHGGGWGGWAGAEEELALGISAKAKGKAKAEPKILGQDAMYAELLSQMYTQTGATVEGATSDAPSHPYSGRPHSVSDPHIPFAYTVDTPPSTPKRADVTDPAHREHLITLLDRWEFEPHKLSDEDVLGCASLLFEAAFEVEGMQEDVGVQFDQLPPFLRAVRKIYRTQNQYHNFQHALDVFQAVYWFLCRAGVVPPVKVLSKNGSHEEGQFVNGQNFIPLDGKWRRSKTQGRIGILRNVDVFALLLAAVGHDVGHPGLSNAFMTNADTPLSRVFDHKSSLEQLHCALLLRLMHKYGMGHLLRSPRKSSSGLVSHASSPGLNATYQRQDSQNGDSLRQPHGFRWLLVQTVLATDMSVHFDWLGRFKAYTEKTGFSGSEDEERLMICQALIKCGDISNPTRPHAVSEHWSKVLLEEWACQATFEQELDLPVTVVNVDVANGAKQQAQGQVNFIDLFTQPLFSATANAIPQLHPITEQCALNRKLWQARMEQLSQATPTAPPRPRTTSGVGSTQEAHYRSIFPLSLPPALSAQPPAVTRPSSSGSASTVGAGSLFSPTGSTSSVASGGMTSGKHTAEPSAVRVAYKASVRKKKSFHRVSWPAPVPAPPPLPMPSPLGEQST